MFTCSNQKCFAIDCLPKKTCESCRKPLPKMWSTADLNGLASVKTTAIHTNISLLGKIPHHIRTNLAYKAQLHVCA